MLIFIIILSTLILIINAELPPFLKPCDVSSSDLNKCLKENIVSAKPYLAEGIPDMFIPSFKNIPIPFSSLDIPGFHFGLWKYVIMGMNEFDLQKVEADFGNNRIKVEAFFPVISGYGLVQVKGNLFDMSFDSMGPIRANVSNIIVSYTLNLSVVERDGKRYMVKDFNEIETKQAGGLLYIHIDNLSFGNETATEMMNDALNEHNDQFLDILLPILQKSLIRLLDSMLDSLFKTYSFDDFFPK